MSPFPDDKKRTRTAGRFDFDRPPSDNSKADWRIQDRTGNPAPGRPAIPAQSTDEYYQQKHAPAPMQKRPKTFTRARAPRPPGSWRPIVAIGTLIGLASFGFVFDLASDGKVRHFILSNLLPPESVEEGKSIANAELPAPALEPPAPALELPAPALELPAPALEPPAPTLEPPAPALELPAPALEPTATEAANVTDLTPSPQETAQDVTAVPLVIQLPLPLEPPQVAVETPSQAEVEPSPLPETAPVPEVPADLPKQETSAAPVTAPQQQGDVIRDCADCPELVVVSAVSLTKVDGANVNSSPKLVTIDHDFAIGRNGITFDDWGRCVDDGACMAIAEDAGWGRGSRPLIFVSYEDVTTQYLPWLSKLSGKVYRLPSKAEWQYAAMGGADVAAPECFNASGPTVGNCVDTFNGTAPGGSFPPNAFGLHDMRGNVWQWSADCWQPFTYAPNASSAACDTRVVLGGAWSTSRSEVNDQSSGWEKSSRRTNSIGFRVVRSLP